MRRQVDGSVEIVSSPTSGFSAADLTASLRHWPRVFALTLLGVSSAAVRLQPLATATLTRLKRLTVREAPAPGGQAAWPMPVLSSTVGATLQVVDFSCCRGLTSINADLWVHIWPSLDAPAKAALRCVCSAMRRQVDGSVEIASSPSSGCTDADLTAALRRWPRVFALTLLGVSSAAVSLQPLATATLTRLKKLTVREAPGGQAAWPMPVFSSTVGATLQVVDFSCCLGLTSIDAVRSCAQLAVLWIPGCLRVSDLSPLAACGETLEELWMADNEQISSLVPLKACTRLAKLDIRGHFYEHDEVEDLRQACPRLADPSTVEVEGLVHELQPGIPPQRQEFVVNELDEIINRGGIDYLHNIAAAGAIPRLVQLLGPHSTATVQRAAASALCSLAYGHTENQSAIAGAIPRLVQLLGCGSAENVQVASAQALANLAAWHAVNQSKIVASGAVPTLVQLLGPESSEDVQQAAADALSDLAASHADNQAAITAAGAIPALANLLGPASFTHVRKTAAWALHNLAADHAQNQAAISTAGAVPPLDLLLGPDSTAEVQQAAANALWNLAALCVTAADSIPPLVLLLEPEGSSEVVQTAAARALSFLAASHSQNKAAITAAGAIPRLVRLLWPHSAAYVQRAAADVLCQLADNNVDNQADIAAAGAIPLLLELQGPGSAAPVQQAAGATLHHLAAHHAED
ncbi:hypothetical protein FOA52_012926 [Chlamydomonas sp. UWO 241]|nr:hypothetical protein FOA52_012926 [Chlamydomonas sp. UWO 241]